MNVSILDPGLRRIINAQSTVDRAIERAELVRLVRDRRIELGRLGVRHGIERIDFEHWVPHSLGEAGRKRAYLERLKRRHQDEFDDAWLRRGMAELALREFDREAGRAPV